MFMGMKKIFFMVLALMFSVSVLRADDRPVSFEKLPTAAQQFVKSKFPDLKVLYATMDDDLIFPEYELMLEGGVELQFANNGTLEKIQMRTPASIPVGIVPQQILDYVKLHYPDAVCTEYEIGRRSYEVKLSNRLELKFNSHFHLIEIDD